MFDLFANLLSSFAAFLFPLYASYKALKTSDPAALQPWLMYWVVFGCLLLAESWTWWILTWVPLYGYVRLGFLLYLMLPQTQGSRIVYESYISPYLQQNEDRIEEFIVHAHETASRIGLDYVKRAIEYFRVNFLGMPPADPDAKGTRPQTTTNAKAYTSALLSRFSMPRESVPAKPNDTATGDFYNFLVSAIAKATATTKASTDTPNDAADQTRASSTSTLIPPSLRDAQEKMAFIATQRERLTMVLGALDQEATHLQRQSPRDGTHVLENELVDQEWPSSGLGKSRGEIMEYVEVDAESCDEADAVGVGARRSSGGSRWRMPWSREPSQE